MKKIFLYTLIMFFAHNLYADENLVIDQPSQEILLRNIQKLEPSWQNGYWNMDDVKAALALDPLIPEERPDFLAALGLVINANPTDPETNGIALPLLRKIVTQIILEDEQNKWTNIAETLFMQAGRLEDFSRMQSADPERRAELYEKLNAQFYAPLFAMLNFARSEQQEIEAALKIKFKAYGDRMDQEKIDGESGE